MKLFRELWRGGSGALALIIATAAPAWATDATGAAPPPDQGAAGPVSPMPTSQQGMAGALLPHPFAPLGVPGAHVLRPGRWQVSYTYGHMWTDGNRVGTDEVSVADILKKYPVAPESMTVNMHMISGMRGITERFAVMAMLPHYFKSMTMVMRNGTRFTTRLRWNRGPAARWPVFTSTARRRTNLFCSGDWGFRPDPSMPGTPRRQRRTPSSAIRCNSVPARWICFRPSPISGNSRWFHWGAQVSGTVRLGENYNDYRWGHRYRVTGWTGYQIYDGLVGSLRLDWQSWGDVHGADPDLRSPENARQEPQPQGGRPPGFPRRSRLVPGSGAARRKQAVY